MKYPNDNVLNDLINHPFVGFDYDGTIGHVPVDWRKAREQFRKHMEGFKPGIELPEDLRMDVLEMKCLADYPGEFDTVFQTRRIVEGAIRGHHRPIDKIISWIEFLGQLPLKPRLFVVSNNLGTTVRDGLQQFNIMHYFDVILGVDDVGSPKPSPASLPILKNFIDIKPEQCAFVGDSPSTDGEFSRLAGFEFLDISQYIFIDMRNSD